MFFHTHFSDYFLSSLLILLQGVGIMSQVVLLFSGQGAQKVGMGADLAERYPIAQELFQQADEILGSSLTGTMFKGPEEELTKTATCQPALFLHGLALLAVLKEKCPHLKPVATAGLSLGEWTAHAAAETFSFQDGLKLVAHRGALMDEACATTPGTMAAVIGGEPEGIAKLAEDCGIDVANYNCPGQIVVSGVEEGVEKAISGAKDAGAKLAKKLNVAGAYHSRLMGSAQEKLGAALKDAPLTAPKIPVIANLNGEPAVTEYAIRETLTSQVTGSVRWTESMQYLLAQGHTTFIELGPGKVLKGFMNRIDKSVTMHVIEDAESLEAVVAELG